MIEASFKYLLIIFSFYYCIPSDIPLESYDFVHIDITPLDLSKNNIGVRCSEINNNSRFSFQTHNWLAENLYLSGGVSPSLGEDVNIFYNLNFGYKKKISYSSFESLLFDLGYHSNRYIEDENKWTSASIVLYFKIKNIHFLPSIIHVFNNDDSKSFMNLNFLYNTDFNFLIGTIMQIYSIDDRVEVLPLISLKYKL